MSLHKSLVARTALERRRNVLTRAERLEILKKDGKWKEGDSIFGLPLVHLGFKVRKVKVKKAKAEEGAAAEGAAAPAAGATPAAGAAAPAAGKKGDAAKGAGKKPEKK